MPEQLTPSAERADARAILERSIQEETKKNKKQKVGEFTEAVQERTEEELETQNIQNIDAVSRETRGLVREYMTDTENTLGKEHKVGDTASKDAVAWNDKGNGNEIVYDHEAASAERDTAYWNRVRIHEETHQKDHAESFDMDAIDFRGKKLKAAPDLVEWAAITKAKQPDSELTPAYREHKRDGDELAAFLGSPDAIHEALKSGKMSALQDAIDRKLMEEAYRNIGLPAKQRERAEALHALAA